MSSIVLNLDVEDETQSQSSQSSQSSNRVQGSKSYSASDYKEYTQREHILNRPDTYLGLTDRVNKIFRMADLTAQKFVNGPSDLPEAMEQTYKEVLTNASDNVPRSIEVGLDPGTIEIIMNETTVSVKNGGRVIPIEMNEEGDKMIPEMIFGTLLTSSNYDDSQKRQVAGRNGYGAKITNIYSNSFMIDIGSSDHGKKYTQVWADNMNVRGEAIIEDYTGENYVQVTYTLDFQRFGFDDKYPETAAVIFAAHAADVAFTCKVPVFFNGIELKASDLKSYSKWHFPDIERGEIVYHEQFDINITSSDKIPSLELAFIDTPDKARVCLLYTSPSPRDRQRSRMPSSA